MENKLYFIIILVGCILLFLGIIIAIIYLWMDRKEDWRDYDSYILSIGWGPSICYNKKEKKEECFDQLDKLNINKSFIIHGLWPTYSSGENIENCNKRDDIEVTFDETYKRYLSKIWPNITNDNIWTKEYNDHGYCYIQRLRKNVDVDYKLYFDKTKEIFSNYMLLMENILPDTPQGLQIITKDRLKFILKNSGFNLDNSTYSLRCEKNEDENKDLLSEIWLNYDFDLINRSKNISSAENCPNKFYIYFRDENKTPVYEKFDFYILSLYWPVSYCKMFGEECYKKFKKKELNILTIHGLWPSYKSGLVPQWCNLDTDIQIDNFTKDMDNYWINTYNNQENKILWNIEYNKHGYCYNKRNNISTGDYMHYFNKTLELYHKFNLKDKMKNDFYPWLFGGENKLNKTYLWTKMSQYFGNHTFALTCMNINNVFYLKEIKLKIDFDWRQTDKGKTEDNCPEEFIVEFLDVDGPKPPAPDDFYKIYDMYFFVVEWQETQCRKRGKYCYDRIPNATKNKFAMHGLWPNLRNGTIVQGFCNGPNDIDIYIKNESLSKFMNLNYVSLYHSNDFFWGHEYNKHGYCYNQRVNHDVNDYEFFFQKCKDMFIDNNFENLFVDFFAKEKIEIKVGDMEINRTKFESFFNDKGFSKDKYLIVCTNITDEYNNTHPHINEIRIRYDLDFNLLKNETDVSEFDCPEIFYAEFL